MTKRNRLALALFKALVMTTAVAGLYLFRAFVTALFGNVAGVVLGAIIFILLVWWLYYEHGDNDEEEIEYSYNYVIVKDDDDADDIADAYEEGGEYVDRFDVNGSLVVVFRYKKD